MINGNSIYDIETERSNVPNYCILFIMGPQPDNFYNLLLFINLVHKPVLDVDSTGIGPFKISDQF